MYNQSQTLIYSISIFVTEQQSALLKNLNRMENFSLIFNLPLNTELRFLAYLYVT